MIKNTNNMSLTLSLNILKALGGDTSIQYETVDDVWVAINEIYGRAGDGIDIEAIILNITENGQYDFDPTDEIDAFAPVHLTVNVPQKYTDEQVESLTNTARQEGYNDGFIDGETDGYNDGYAEGLDEGFEDGVIDQKGKLEDITFTANGTYTREDGWDNVTVAIEIPDIPTFETETLSVNLTDNGTYNYTPTTDGFSSVSVNVNVESTGTGKPKVYNGFRFTSGYPLQVDFSQYDWSDVYDLSYMFAGCRTDNADNWTNFQNNFNGRILSLKSAFAKDGAYCVSKLPSFTTETANCYDMSQMCQSNNNLTGAVSLQHWDTSNVRNMTTMFNGCSNITSVTLGDTSNVRNMSNMFQGCSSLTSVPEMDTSNVTTMSDMFNSCSSLTSVPEMDTSNVYNMNNMFRDCRNITSIPYFDTSNVVIMNNTFYNCQNLTTVPEMDFSSVRKIDYMFGYCYKLEEIPNCNFINVETFGGYSSWLQNSTKLKKIGIIDCDSIYNVQYGLGSGTNLALTDLGGFRNLGMASNVQNTNSDYFLYYAPNLTHESLMNIINNLYDRKSAGYTVLTLKMHPNHLALLTADEIAIATNKGWTIA